MGFHALELATRSHVGLRRPHNQDSLKVDAQQGVIVLADGMGGHKAGEVASRIAADVAQEELLAAQSAESADRLVYQMRVGQAIESANQGLLGACEQKPELQGMGTTIVVALFRDKRIFYAHVGDSRLYRVRFGRVRRFTRDHTLIQQMIDDGVFLNRTEARNAGIRDNVLTRSLGLQRQAEMDVGDAPLEAGDLFLLCSDGLHGLLSDTEIARILRDPNGVLEEQAESLVGAALDAGGDDNVSVILARPLIS